MDGFDMYPEGLGVAFLEGTANDDMDEATSSSSHALHRAHAWLDFALLPFCADVACLCS